MYLLPCEITVIGPRDWDVDIFGGALFCGPVGDWVAGTIRAMGAELGLRLLRGNSLGWT